MYFLSSSSIWLLGMYYFFGWTPNLQFLWYICGQIHITCYHAWLTVMIWIYNYLFIDLIFVILTWDMCAMLFIQTVASSFSFCEGGFSCFNIRSIFKVRYFFVLKEFPIYWYINIIVYMSKKKSCLVLIDWIPRNLCGTWIYIKIWTMKWLNVSHSL